MAEQKRILIICGEPSGDLHAANLAKKILDINPEIKVSGVGGALLRSTGADIIYDIKGLAAIGLFDVLKKLPRFFSLKKFILQKIKAEPPDLIILVDFSGFNLRLAKAVNKSVPIIYYVSPQVWASRAGRVKTIKNYINKMLVLFKFEEEFYKRYGIDADFVGHPLLDIVEPAIEKKKLMDELGFSETKRTIALLPGSRRQEIKNILPVMLEAAGFIDKELPAQFVVAKSCYVDWDIYDRIIRRSNAGALGIKIVESKTYDSLNIADFALVASGTATLETAIMQVPFCIVYRTSLLNYLLYLPQVRIPYIGMVNIIAGRKIVPEFIQFNATAKKIAAQALKTLANPAEMERIKNELAKVKSLLGEKGASSRAAKIILDFLFTQIGTD